MITMLIIKEKGNLGAFLRRKSSFLYYGPLSYQRLSVTIKILKRCAQIKLITAKNIRSTQVGSGHKVEKPLPPLYQSLKLQNLVLLLFPRI